MSRPLTPLYNEEIRRGRISPVPHLRPSYIAGTPTDQRDTAAGTAFWSAIPYRAPVVVPYWWANEHYEEAVYEITLAEDATVMVAGAAGLYASMSGIGQGCGAAGEFTMAAGTYYLSVGASSNSNARWRHTTPWTEPWGFGGVGNWNASYSGSTVYLPACGGGRTELRTSTSRGDAILIAPGGGGAPLVSSSYYNIGDGNGGWIAGNTRPPVSQFRGEGANQSDFGEGGNYQIYNYNAGYDGDGNQGGSVELLSTLDVGSGGQGGRGTVYFGSGSPGGGGGAGKHGGGGGSGGAGNSGGIGGGGSGDTSGAKTIVATQDGVNAGAGWATAQIERLSSAIAASILDLDGLTAYVPCEEPQIAKLGATELVNNEPFLANKIWSQLASQRTLVESVTQAEDTTPDGRLGARQSAYSSIQSRSTNPTGWNPPEFNNGQDWAVEWSYKSLSGNNYGPGHTNFSTGPPGGTTSFRWSAFSNPTQMGLYFYDGGVYRTKTVALTGVNLVQWVRCGISYNSVDDTFYFYRFTEDGVFQSSATTRTAAPTLPTTGDWMDSESSVGRGTVSSLYTSVSHSGVSSDVCVFNQHRTSAAFVALANFLGYTN